MGVIFRPEESKSKKAKKISKELGISEEEAEELIEKREKKDSDD